MSRPTILTGATQTISIDGIDMKEYGMLVTGVDNPLPQVRESTMSIPGRDGDFDFTRHYGGRIMTISGYVTGDSHSGLMANLDSLKAFFRLRENGSTFKVIFQDQSTRYWTSRYAGGFSPNFQAPWMYGRAVNFSLTLYCVKPYAEATTVTTANWFLHCLQNRSISYAGSLRTPLAINLKPRVYANLQEAANGPSSEGDYWNEVNCTSSTDTTRIYGAYSVKLTRSTAAPFYATSNYVCGSDVTKNYVIGGYIYGFNDSHVTLQAMANSSVVASSAFGQVPAYGWGFAFVKVTAAMLTATSGLMMRVYDDGGDASILVDGLFCYEITAAEAADSTYFPPPYMSDTAGDDYVPPKNPKLLLCRNINIAPIKNGVNPGWVQSPEKVTMVADPFGSDDMCFLYSTASPVSQDVYSPVMYLTGGKTYKISFDYYVEHFTGTQAYVGFSGFVEGGLVSNQITWIVAYAAGTGWATYQAKHTAGMAEAEGRIFFGAYDGVVRIYVKNIMVVEAVTPADAYDAYVAPDQGDAEYTGTFDDGDNLILDNDRMTAYKQDFSTGLSTNGLINLVSDRLCIEPGTNVLRYLDARAGAAAPEAESCGGMYATVSYRARYL